MIQVSFYIPNCLGWDAYFPLFGLGKFVNRTCPYAINLEVDTISDTGVPLGKRGLTYFGGACALRFLNFNFWEPVRSRFQDLTSNF